MEANLSANGPMPREFKGRRKSDIASGGEPPYDERMEARVTKLEADVAEIKLDIGVIKATCATKADIAEAQTKIIMWVVMAIFLAQLLPIFKDFVQALPPSPPEVVARPGR